LVGEVFRLLDRRKVPWVVLENVPFMLQLNQGKALRTVVSALEERFDPINGQHGPMLGG
jgi:DNA (cytosine-5)-methyltransferase 1